MPGFEKRFGIGERDPFLERRHDQLLWIALFYFTFPSNRVLGGQTSAVEVEIEVEVLGAEEVDLGREALRDMGVAKALAQCPELGRLYRREIAKLTGVAPLAATKHLPLNTVAPSLDPRSRETAAVLKFGTSGR